jgi:hypothetical protein
MRTQVSLLMVIGVLLTFLNASVRGAIEPQIHKGTVVSAGGGQLVMKDTAGKEHTHLVSKETKITINGRLGRLEELKPTTLIRVTTEGSDKVVSVATVDDDKLRFKAD